MGTLPFACFTKFSSAQCIVCVCVHVHTCARAVPLMCKTFRPAVCRAHPPALLISTLPDFIRCLPRVIVFTSHHLRKGHVAGLQGYAALVWQVEPCYPLLCMPLSQLTAAHVRAELCEAFAAKKNWRAHQGGRLDTFRSANWLLRAALAGHSGIVLAFWPPGAALDAQGPGAVLDT